MAGDASAVAQTLDEVAKPPTGVVLPPKDIRAILEKTAGYSARNGPAFEDRIRAKEANNPRFSFLNSHDAYYPYYAWRLDEIRAGRGNAVSAGRAGEDTPKQPEEPKGPEPPPEFHFSARMPNISAQDLDVVKLTALFVAKNGRSFATTLSQRESTKSQFDFLRQQHSLYQFFSRLVDQYTELLTGGDVNGGRPERTRVLELEKNVRNKFGVLDRARKRAEWVKYQEAQKAKKEEEAEAERVAYAQIDWHDFVVVETVVFNEADEQTDLPPPTSLSDLQTASLEQKANMSLAPHNMRIEEAMPTEDDYPAPSLPYNPMPASLPPRLDIEPIQPQNPLPQMPQPVPQATASQVPVQPVRIREGGVVPRAMARRRNAKMVKCPQCGLDVAMDDLEQHMKIELLDPQWREQRAKADSRHATTNLSTHDVAENLKRLASQRDDVFDPITGRPLSEDEQARMKKTATFVGDPNADQARRSGHAMTLNEQIKSIQERFRQ